MSDQDQAVTTQNAARQDANTNHGSNCAPLVWDGNLAAAAQDWANHLASINSMDHSDGNSRPGQGENLFSYWATNGTPNFNSAAVDWCGEISNYSGEPIGAGNFEGYGHYTQVVWPSTTAVGMGIAQGSSGWFYVVGRYSPPGNVAGQSAWGSAPGPPAPTPAPGPPHSNVVFLVNSFKNGQRSSGFASYNNFDNSGKQPDMYVDIDACKNVQWEGNSYSGTFQNGHVFTCTVNANGQAVPTGTAVGTAHTPYQQFTVYKDDQRVLYTVDGWQVSTIYKCVN